MKEKRKREDWEYSKKWDETEKWKYKMMETDNNEQMNSNRNKDKEWEITGIKENREYYRKNEGNEN